MSRVDEKMKRNPLKGNSLNVDMDSESYKRSRKRMKQQREIRDRRAAKRSVTEIDGDKEALGKGSVNW